MQLGDKVATYATSIKKSLKKGIGKSTCSKLKIKIKLPQGFEKCEKFLHQEFSRLFMTGKLSNSLEIGNETK